MMCAATTCRVNPGSMVPEVSLWNIPFPPEHYQSAASHRTGFQSMLSPGTGSLGNFCQCSAPGLWWDEAGSAACWTVGAAFCQTWTTQLEDLCLHFLISQMRIIRVFETSLFAAKKKSVVFIFPGMQCLQADRLGFGLVGSKEFLIFE